MLPVRVAASIPIAVLASSISCQPVPSSVPLGGTSARAQPTGSREPDPTPRATPRPQPTPTKATPPRGDPGSSAPTERQPTPEGPSPTQHEPPPPQAKRCSVKKVELGSCSEIRPPVEACAESGRIAQYCRAANRLMQPAVARAYYDCVYQYSGSEALCAPELMPDCFVRATQAACVRRSFANECEVLLADCPNLPAFLKKNCEATLGSVKSDEREAFLRCLSRCDVAKCIARSGR